MHVVGTHERPEDGNRQRRHKAPSKNQPFSRASITTRSDILFDLDIANASKEIKKKFLLANRKAAKIILTEVLRLAPVGPTGNLKNGIKLMRGRKTRYDPDANLGYRIMSTAPHSTLVNWGTVIRKNTRGANRGKMPRNQFMLDAAKNKRSEALKVYENII